jgi:2-dehydropantoate 2-reductase
MEPFKGRIGILGAGALGALYGARLSQVGHDVHFLMRSDYEAVKRDGLFVKSFEGDFHIKPPVYATPEELGMCDLLIIGLKTTANDALPALLGPTAGPQTLVLTLQNGLGNEDAITGALRHIGPDAASRVLGGIAFLCSNRTALGHIHHMDHGWIRMGEFASPITERTHAIAALFTSANIRCEVYDNLMQARWEKLVWNIPFNGLGVAAGANVQQVLKSPELRHVAHTLMNETVAAANATGVPVNPEMAEKMLKNSESMGPYRSSMQVDYEKLQKLEVESIIGEPLRRGLAAGAQLPTTQMLYALVKYKNDEDRDKPF